jgi:hypothetical protein
VIVRGNNRAEIFCAEADYRFYLEKLQIACDKHACTESMAESMGSDSIDRRVVAVK